MEERKMDMDEVNVLGTEVKYDNPVWSFLKKYNLIATLVLLLFGFWWLVSKYYYGEPLLNWIREVFQVEESLIGSWAEILVNSWGLIETTSGEALVTWTTVSQVVANKDFYAQFLDMMNDKANKMKFTFDSTKVNIDTNMIDHSYIWDLYLASPILSISWNVSSGAQEVYVYALKVDQDAVNDNIANNELKLLSEAKLQKFKAGDKVRKYNINPNFDNIDPGQNFYVFVAKMANGNYVYSQLVLNAPSWNDYFKHVTWKKCIIDVCTVWRWKIVTSGDMFIQTFVENQDSTLVSEFIPGKSIKFVKQSMWWGEEIAEIKSDYIVVNKAAYDCGGGWKVSQKVYWLDEKLIKEGSLWVPKTIVLGNLKLINPKITYDWSFYNVPVSINNLTVKDLFNEVWGEQPWYNVLSTKVAVISEEWIKVLYELDQSVFAWKASYEGHGWAEYIIRPKILEENLDPKIYEMKTLNSTNETLNALFKYSPLAFVDKDDNSLAERNENGIMTSKVISNYLPVIGYFPIDKDYDVIFAVRWHKFVFMAEFCKPAIYVYDSKSRKNSVTLLADPLSQYTKLIPEFTIDKWWDFTPTNDILVDVDGQEFKYLYYSILVPNFEFNKFGRHVAWKDTNKFFIDKLTKIGLRQNEIDDFVTYWDDRFVDDQNYFLSFKFNEELDKYVELKFANKPYSINRILLEATEIKTLNPIYDYSKVGSRYDSKLLKSFERNPHFDAFERGGVYKDLNGKTYVY